MARIPQDGCVRLMAGADGSMYLILSGTPSLAEVAYQGAMLSARMRGDEITPEMEEAIAQWALAKEAEHLAAVRARGVPSNIRQLFQAKRKKEALHFAKTMVIDDASLQALFHNAEMVGVSHHSEHFDFTPEERELTDAEKELLAAPEPDQATRKAQKKVRQLFVEREHRSVHCFTNDREWHCFYLTFRDIAGDPLTGEHHWKEGAHLHYIGHLLVDLPVDRVQAALGQRQHSLPSVHVRYRHADAGKRPRRFLHADGKTGRVVEVPAE